MGQLEKYGLYVLCLVIFLILGVAIWGGDPAPHSQAQKEAIKLAAEQDQGKSAERSAEKVPEKAPEPQKAEPRNEVNKGPEGGAKSAATDKPKVEGARPNPFEGFLVPESGKPVTSKQPATNPAESTPKPVVAKPEPTKAEPRVHVVRHGDTLHDLAVAEYGDATRVADILAMNPGLQANRMREGIKIKLPPAKPKAAGEALAKKEGTAKTAEGTKTTPVAGATYKVRSGDTLTSISRAAYGNERHVKEILAANRGRLASADRLRENMVLSLPAASPSGR